MHCFIESGSDKIAQKSAAYILNRFMAYLLDENYFDLSNYFAPKIVALYIKSSCADFEFTNCLVMILKQLGVKYFVSALTDFHEYEISQLRYQ